MPEPPPAADAGSFGSGAGAVTGSGQVNLNTVTFEQLRQAVVHGSVLASFNVEAFSLERLRSLTQNEIEERYAMFRLMSQFEVI